MANLNDNLIDYQYSVNEDEIQNILILDFDLDNFSFDDLIGLIKFRPNNFFYFETTNGKSLGRGMGAIRQVYNKLIKEISHTIFETDGVGYFVKFNLNHPFWTNTSNCKAFGRFIHLVIASGCIFPFHFPVAMIEELTQPSKRLNESEMLYFIEKMDPDVYSSIKNVDFRCFVDHSIPNETGFDSLYDMLSYIIYGSYTEDNCTKLYRIYKEITNGINLFSYPSDPNTPTIDYILSGEYELTPEIVFKMTNIITEYEVLWKILFLV